MTPVSHAAVSSSTRSEAAVRPRTAGLSVVPRLATDAALETSESAQSGDTDQPHPDVDALVESICAQGCKVVYQVIARLQAGETPLEMAHLDTSATAAVLAELESIMAVYAENGSICLTKGK